MNCTITAEELIRVNDLARIHESTAKKKADDPKAEGIEMEYAARLLAIRKLFGIDKLGNTFRVPIFNAIESPTPPPEDQPQ